MLCDSYKLVPGATTTCTVFPRDNVGDLPFSADDVTFAVRPASGTLSVVACTDPTKCTFTYTAPTLHEKDKRSDTIRVEVGDVILDAVYMEIAACAFCVGILFVIVLFASHCNTLDFFWQLHHLHVLSCIVPIQFCALDLLRHVNLLRWILMVSARQLHWIHLR